MNPRENYCCCWGVAFEDATWLGDLLSWLGHPNFSQRYLLEGYVNLCCWHLYILFVSFGFAKILQWVFVCEIRIVSLRFEFILIGYSCVYMFWSIHSLLIDLNWLIDESWCIYVRSALDKTKLKQLDANFILRCSCISNIYILLNGDKSI